MLGGGVALGEITEFCTSLVLLPLRDSVSSRHGMVGGVLQVVCLVSERHSSGAYLSPPSDAIRSRMMLRGPASSVHTRLSLSLSLSLSHSLSHSLSLFSLSLFLSLSMLT